MILKSVEQQMQKIFGGEEEESPCIDLTGNELSYFQQIQPNNFQQMEARR